MAEITCFVTDNLTERPAVGMNVYLLCLTHKTSLNEREFRAKIGDTGRNGEWEFQGNGKIKASLEAFIADTCEGQESQWQLICSAGMYYGGDEISWPMVGIFFYLRRAERRTITISVSHHEIKAFTYVENTRIFEVIKAKYFSRCFADAIQRATQKNYHEAMIEGDDQEAALALISLIQAPFREIGLPNRRSVTGVPKKDPVGIDASITYSDEYTPESDLKQLRKDLDRALNFGAALPPFPVAWRRCLEESFGGPLTPPPTPLLSPIVFGDTHFHRHKDTSVGNYNAVCPKISEDTSSSLILGSMGVNRERKRARSKRQPRKSTRQRR